MNQLDIDQIICGDNLQIMAGMPDESIDLILTDPPYNSGIRYGIEFDDKRPMNAYLSWMKERFQQMGRILKIGGSLVFTYSSCGLERLGAFLPDSLIPVRSAVWHKPFSPSPYSGMGWSWHFEMIIWWAKGKPGCRGTWNDSDVISVNPVCRALRTAEWVEHPCQKPLALWIYLLELMSEKDDVVLDPFLGSGTTSVAAIRTGRHYIGIDISKNYCDIARKRTEAENSQLKLIFEEVRA